VVDKIGTKAHLFTRLAKQRVVVLGVAGLLASGATVAYSLRFAGQKPSEPPPPKAVPAPEAVTSLGRIEPKGEAIQLSPPPTQGSAKVAQVLVEEGDVVRSGQTVAILDTYVRRVADVERVKQDVAVAQADLAVVEAGAKAGEIKAQQATIERLQAQLLGENAVKRANIAILEAQLQGEIQEQAAIAERLRAELVNAQSEFDRYQYLAQEGAISASELDSRRLDLETTRERLLEAQATDDKTISSLQEQIREAKALSQQATQTLQKQIQEAQANLERIAEVRFVDVQRAKAEVERAKAALGQAQVDLELASVKAPIDSQILKVHTRPGESVGEEGIVELGQTEQMMVVAEVYESDISKVRLGQSVIVTSESGAFAGELRGTVSQVGLLIGKNDVLDTDPAADVDTRVVEVKILLSPEDSDRVAGLTNSKVITQILL
jgi:HlyD family secretion protein